MFDLKASNGEIIGMSEVYNTRDSQGHCRDDREQQGAVQGSMQKR